MFASPARLATDFTHAYGCHVRDVMTKDVLDVPHDAPLEEVVATMEQYRIKRLPVTEDGRVVGIVSRSDLLRALVKHMRDIPPSASDDRTIRSSILDALEAQPWAPMTTLNVTVAGGVVDVWGSVTNDAERHAIRVLAENMQGVAKVNDHLVYIEPYSATVIETPDKAS